MAELTAYLQKHFPGLFIDCVDARKEVYAAQKDGRMLVLNLSPLDELQAFQWAYNQIRMWAKNNV